MERAVENEILFKDYAEHVKRVREGIKQKNRERCQQQDRPVIFLAFSVRG